MFISEKGEDKFSVMLTGFSADGVELVKSFPAEKKLLFVYGNFTGIADNQLILTA